MDKEFRRPQEGSETPSKEFFRSFLENEKIHAFMDLMQASLEKGEASNLERIWKETIESYDDEEFKRRLGDFKHFVTYILYYTELLEEVFNLYQVIIERSERLVKPSRMESDKKVDKK